MINYSRNHIEHTRWMWVFGFHDTLRFIQPETDGLGCEHPSPEIWNAILRKCLDVQKIRNSDV